MTVTTRTTAVLPDVTRRLREVLGERARSDLGSRALYTSDASLYRVLPQLVAEPVDADELAIIAATCAEAGVPLTMRGAGTSIAGNAVGPGVVVSTRFLDRVIELDPETQVAVVEPGVVLDDLNALAARHGLRLGPDPSTHSRCTLGGMIANNACGSHSVAWGTTAQNVLGLDVIRSDGGRVRLTSPDAAASAGTPGADRDWPSLRGDLAADLAGELDRFTERYAPLLRAELPPWPRRVSGYALDWLLPEHGRDVARALVGTEGTCALIARATVRLVRPPAARALLVLGFDDDIAGAEAVPALLAAAPFTVESLSAELLTLAHASRHDIDLPAGGAWLLVEARANDAGAARDHAARLVAAIGRRLDDPDVRFITHEAEQAALWRIREDGAGHSSRLADGRATWPGFEDSAVPPERLGSYLRELRALLREQDLQAITYGHYGEGCIHLRVGFGLDRPGGTERFERFMSAAADLVVAHGGTLSGEHGDGRARSALLERQFSPELRAAFADFKAIWDPAGVLNPAIIVAPQPVTADVRVAAPGRLDVKPAQAYSRDGGDFRSAVERCIGIGRCVSTQGSELMCPSYRATRDEQHSTRGRARLLQEMVAGSLANEGWGSKEVYEALDLCLACRGCVSQCPTSVDMAAYKAEFLHHHFRRRLRPLSHYSLGWLPLWLTLAATLRVPWLVNLVTRSRLTRRIFTRAAGIAAERGIPPLARRSFSRDRKRQLDALPANASTNRANGRVVLWPDTFNNHLTPTVAHDAVRVLEAAGFEIVLPARTVCCGLTWHTTGQLDMAKRVLRRSLGAPELAGDDPVVVLEPSCATMLREDLRQLLPDDPRAASLAGRVTTLAELLDGIGFVAPRAAELAAGAESTPGGAAAAAAPAISQPHCHQQAVLGLSADRRVLARNGIEVGKELQGCCGLAGNFGAERGHEAISQSVAELELLPALRAADPETPLLADGFSCRTQIEALSGRRARHLAEVLAERL